MHTLLATFQTEVGVFENPQDHIHTTAWQGIYLQFSTDDPLMIVSIYRLEKLVEEVSKHPRFEAVTWISWMIFFRFRLRMVIKGWSKGRENLKIWSWARNVAHSKTKAEGWVPLSPLWVFSETVGKRHGNVPGLACRAYHRAVMRVKLFEILALKPRAPVHRRSVELQRETISEFRSLGTHKPFQPRFKGPWSELEILLHGWQDQDIFTQPLKK